MEGIGIFKDFWYMFSFNYLLLYNKITTSGWLQVTSVYYFCIWYWLGPLMRLHSAASSGEGAIFEMTSLVSGTLTGIVGIAGGWRVLSLCTSSLVIQLSSLNLHGSWIPWKWKWKLPGFWRLKSRSQGKSSHQPRFEEKRNQLQIFNGETTKWHCRRACEIRGIVWPALETIDHILPCYYFVKHQFIIKKCKKKTLLHQIGMN